MTSSTPGILTPHTLPEPPQDPYPAPPLHCKPPKLHPRPLTPNPNPQNPMNRRTFPRTAASSPGVTDSVYLKPQTPNPRPQILDPDP